jgi:arylsulfatase A-like enzyme
MKELKIVAFKRIRFVILALSGILLVNCTKEEKLPPNILWIQTDEQRTSSLGCYGSNWARTPHIDRIASTGTIFTRAYTQCPQCVPARNSQLTARYPQEVNCTFNQADIPFPDGTLSIVDVLNEAGYRTVTYGKQHTTAPIAWDEARDWILNPDYAGYYSINEKYDPEEYGVITPSGARQGGIIRAGVYPGGDDHPSRNITDWAIEFLKGRDKGQPFFLRVSHNYPHTPVLPSKPWDSYYNVDEIPVVYPEMDAVKTRSSWDQEASQWKALSKLSKEDYDRTWQHYMGLCAQVDHEVGRLMQVMDELGLTENTMIVFSADHGAGLGEFGLVTKGTFDDPSWRIPFIWSWPGHVPQGLVSEELCELTDMNKTLLKLCGMEDRIPETWRGRDLFNDPAPDAVFGQIGYPNMNSVVGRKGDSRPHFAQLRIGMRTPRYRMDYTYMKNGEKMPVEDGNLFDLMNDPGELKNLWDDPDLQETKSDLARRMDLWFEEIDKPAILFETVDP